MEERPVDQEEMMAGGVLVVEVVVVNFFLLHADQVLVGLGPPSTSSGWRLSLEPKVQRSVPPLYLLAAWLSGCRLVAFKHKLCTAV